MDIKTSATPREQQKEAKTINHVRHQWYVGGYVIMAVGCLVLYILARLHVLYLPPY
ncbi:MAG: hypothetical protein ABW019_06740 [Chitinophagaceae bacterium]